jgi:hypothetical protein
VAEVVFDGGVGPMVLAAYCKDGKHMSNLRRDWNFLPGITFDAPVPEYYALLQGWLRHEEEPFNTIDYKYPPHECFLRACRLLFTRKQLSTHPWFERMAYGHTHNRTMIVLGAASTGKSHFAGVATLLAMVADIGNVYSILVSTSKEALLKRSYASVLEYLNCLKANGAGVPLKFVAQKTAVVPDNASDDLTNVKSRIDGVAMSEGSEEDAKRSVIGVHLPRVRAICDEIEVLGNRAKAFLSAQANLVQGCSDYRMLILFNPMGMHLPGTQLATPRDQGGWASLDPDAAEEWFTRAGHYVLRLDGFKSPGIKDPKEYGFLPTRQSIDHVIQMNHGNADSPDVWAMVRGFPPLNTATGTVLTDAELLKFKALEDEQWLGDGRTPGLVGGLDPAFTSDGDSCVLQLADVGYLVGGILAVKYRDPIYIKIEASSATPVSYQIVEQLRKVMSETGLQLNNLAIDDSGTQSIADIVTKELGYGCFRVNFGARASDSSVSMVDARPAYEVWGNSGTELWGAVAEYVRYGQVRRMPAKAAEQFTRRQFDINRRPKILKSKKKSRMDLGDRSPDEGDAAALCAAIARFVLGLKPGASTLDPGGLVPVVPTSSFDRTRMLALNNLRSTYGM